MKWVLFFMMVSVCLFADEVATEVAVVAAPQGLSILDKINEWLGGVAGWATLSGIGVVIFDLILRIFKSKKPLSLAWVLRDICIQIARIFSLIAQVLDKFLPQRIVASEQPKEEKK